MTTKVEDLATQKQRIGHEKSRETPPSREIKAVLVELVGGKHVNEHSAATKDEQGVEQPCDKGAFRASHGDQTKVQITGTSARNNSND